MVDEWQKCLSQSGGPKGIYTPVKGQTPKRENNINKFSLSLTTSHDTLPS